MQSRACIRYRPHADADTDAAAPHMQRGHASFKMCWMTPMTMLAGICICICKHVHCNSERFRILDTGTTSAFRMPCAVHCNSCSYCPILEPRTIAAHACACCASQLAARKTQDGTITCTIVLVKMSMTTSTASSSWHGPRHRVNGYCAQWRSLCARLRMLLLLVLLLVLCSSYCVRVALPVFCVRCVLCVVCCVWCCCVCLCRCPCAFSLLCDVIHEHIIDGA